MSVNNKDIIQMQLYLYLYGFIYGQLTCLFLKRLYQSMLLLWIASNGFQLQSPIVIKASFVATCTVGRLLSFSHVIFRYCTDHKVIYHTTTFFDVYIWLCLLLSEKQLTITVNFQLGLNLIARQTETDFYRSFVVKKQVILAQP